jgi:hypothetical protein
MPKIGYPRLVSRSDKPPAQPAVLPPSKVQLVNRETNATSVHFIIDAIEILTAPGSVYGIVEGTNYSESFLRRIGHGPSEPEAA